MTDGDGTVRKKLHLLWFTPLTTRTLAAVNLRTQVLAVDGLRIGEIHRPAVATETAYTYLRRAGRLAACRVVLLLAVRRTVQTLRQTDVTPFAGCVLTRLV